MSVKKAVIPVAGLGTRFLPATKAIPKELLPIVDKPSLQYVVEEAVASGISEIIFVTNNLKALIEDHFRCDTSYDQALEKIGKSDLLTEHCTFNTKFKLTTVYQKQALGLGHAVLMAKKAVGNEPFVVLLPDMIIDDNPPCTKRLIDTFDEFNKPVILVDHAPREMISQYGIVGTGKKFKDRVFEITSMVEKPKPEDAPSDLYIAGRYLLPPEIFSILERVKPGKGGEIQLTDALVELAKKGMLAEELKGTLHDTGDKLGYLEANIYYALKNPKLGIAVKDYIKKIS